MKRTFWGYVDHDYIIDDQKNYIRFFSDDGDIFYLTRKYQFFKLLSYRSERVKIIGNLVIHHNMMEIDVIKIKRIAPLLPALNFGFLDFHKTCNRAC